MLAHRQSRGTLSTNNALGHLIETHGRHVNVEYERIYGRKRETRTCRRYG